MILEQACRFRMGSGYGICARSPHFTNENDINFEGSFNDVMNVLFGKVGQQILTCTASGGDVFFARSTMRTDIKGRKTLLTNACVLSAQEYEQRMSKDPAFLFQIPVQELPNYQPGNSEIPPLKTEEAKVVDLNCLREKYHLDDERYGELLYGGYQAMTGNGALCLRTEKNLEEAEEMVKELAYCTALGLLPAMRGKLSFSSGMDCRKSICVDSADGGEKIQFPESVFYVDRQNASMDDMDNLTRKFFVDLAGSGEEQREKILSEIQNWLENLTGTGAENAPFGMIVAAYYLSQGISYTSRDATFLFSSILVGLKSRDFKPTAADGVLAQLLNRMTEDQYCTEKILEKAIFHYVKESTEIYRTAVLRTIEAARQINFTPFLKSLLGLPCTETITELVQSILGRIPTDTEEFRSYLAPKVIDWALKYDVISMQNDCQNLLDNYSFVQQKDLVRNILENKDGQLLNHLECDMLSPMLGELIEQFQHVCDPEMKADMPDVSALEFNQLPEELKETCVAYFIIIQVQSKANIADCVDVLFNLQKKNLEMFTEVSNQIRTDNQYQKLWENFQTVAQLRDECSRKEMIEICQKCNVFQDPNGVFEKRFRALWNKAMGSELRAARNLSDALHIIAIDIDDVCAAHISRESKSLALNEDVAVFWDCIDYGELVTDFQQIMHTPKQVQGEILNRSTSDPKKTRLWRCIRELYRKPENTEDIYSLFIEQTTYTGSEQWAIREALPDLIRILAEEQGYLCWDLVMICCQEHDKPGEFDYRKAIMLVENIAQQGCCNTIMETAEKDSIILRDEGVRRKLRKAAASSKIPLLMKLTEELTPKRVGLFSSLTGAFGQGKKGTREAPKSGMERTEISRPFQKEETHSRLDQGSKAKKSIWHSPFGKDVKKKGGTRIK